MTPRPDWIPETAQRMNDAPIFALDPRLAADTLPLCDLDLCRVLLMNDARYAWLILVPRLQGLEEIDQLDAAQRTRLLDEIARCSDVLRSCVAVDKINVGALGNIVRQLHVHVVARRIGDAAWPGPVWGHGRAQPYPLQRAAEFTRALTGQLQRGP
jgi:diadenosine tetraphosphate (Ap4A) HIT family hydrolase